MHVSKNILFYLFESKLCMSFKINEYFIDYFVGICWKHQASVFLFLPEK